MYSDLRFFTTSRRSLTLCLALFAAGCGASNDLATDPSAEDLADDVSEAESVATKLTIGEFDLYPRPWVSVPKVCENYTKLALVNKSGARAELSDAAAGACPEVVDANARRYRLKLTDTNSCGAKIYKGAVTKRDGRHTIVITDNRSANICRQPVIALIVVEETAPNKAPTTYYSFDKGAGLGAVCGDGILGRPLAPCASGYKCEYPATGPKGPTGSSSAPAGKCVSSAPAHAPVCANEGTPKEGWVWADTNQLIKTDKCAGAHAYCGRIDDRTYWGRDDTNAMIKWDTCTP